MEYTVSGLAAEREKSSPPAESTRSLCLLPWIRVSSGACVQGSSSNSTRPEQRQQEVTAIHL